MCGQLSAQWLEPKRLQLGMSGGIGGVHAFGKLSFDLHKGGTSLSLAPGLFYGSVGISQRIGFYRPAIRRDRHLILSYYYHEDWLLSPIWNKRHRNPRTDLDIHILMLGIRANLNRKSGMYVQGGLGAMYIKETLKPLPEVGKKVLHHVLPMLEFKIGGLFLQRKYPVQNFDKDDKGWLKIKIQVSKKKKKKPKKRK
jgi:hypothetical protein